METSIATRVMVKPTARGAVLSAAMSRVRVFLMAGGGGGYAAGVGGGWRSVMTPPSVDVKSP